MLSRLWASLPRTSSIFSLYSSSVIATGHGLALHHIPEMAVIFFVGALTGGAFVTWEALELVPPLAFLFVVAMYVALKMNKKPVVWRVLLGFVSLCIFFFVTGMVLGLRYTIWSHVP